MNAAGTTDTTFHPSPVTLPTTIVVQSNGKILVFAPAFEPGAGLSTLARLNADGTVDTRFDGTAVATNGYADCIALQSDPTATCAA